MHVPDVLLSGDHEAIERWRREQARQVTAERRPDLLGASGGESSPRTDPRRDRRG
jgi:tRNA (guanine37-N1)-methyltransferase